MSVLLLGVAIGIVACFLLGVRIILPSRRGLVEVFGKYRSFAGPGFHWVMPWAARMVLVDTMERVVSAEPQSIVTEDNLNAYVDARIRYRVLPDETSVRASRYNIDDCRLRIVDLARETLRSIIGSMTLRSAGSGRSKIDEELLDALRDGTRSWGISVVSAELVEMDMPRFRGQ
jgi:regulator of protease activity HflC (stomatin/prohibitin superfamily)